jgi:hypothetical protein
MLVASALALLVVVVVTIGALLTVDLRRTEHQHWLDALKTWQALIGSVLGFLGAAGVLVLSPPSVTTTTSRSRSRRPTRSGSGWPMRCRRLAWACGLPSNSAITILRTAIRAAGAPTMPKLCSRS